MILDNLQAGQYFIFESSDQYEGFPINGEPMLVRAVSLPWVSFSP